MNVRNLLTVHAILVALVALTTLLAPTFFLETNGLEISQTSINQMRAFGAINFGFVITSWLMRDQPASKTRQAYLLGVSVSFLLFSVVNVINITAMADLENNIPWAIFGLNVLLGAAFLLFAYKEPAS